MVDSTTQATRKLRTNLNRSAYKSFFVRWIVAYVRCYYKSGALPKPNPTFCTLQLRIVQHFSCHVMCLSYSDRQRHPYLSFVQRWPHCQYVGCSTTSKTYRMQKLWFRFSLLLLVEGYTVLRATNDAYYFTTFSSIHANARARVCVPVCRAVVPLCDCDCAYVRIMDILLLQTEWFCVCVFIFVPFCRCRSPFSSSFDHKSKSQ